MRQKGFTLVELLVAIGIIGILSSIAVVSISNVRAKARDAKRVGDVKQIQTALESYFNDWNVYPPTNAALGGDTATVLCATYSDNTIVNGFAKPAVGVTCGATYLNPVPKNPTPGGEAYNYAQVSGGSDYTIDFTLESGSGTLVKGAYKATPNGIVAD